MRNIIHILLLAIVLCACDGKCYTCTREVARTSDKPFPGYPVGATLKFKATKEEAEVFNNSFIVERDTIDGIILMSNIKTTCYK